jgi:hypothetical protein
MPTWPPTVVRATANASPSWKPRTILWPGTSALGMWTHESPPICAVVDRADRRRRTAQRRTPSTTLLPGSTATWGKLIAVLTDDELAPVHPATELVAAEAERRLQPIVAQQASCAPASGNWITGPRPLQPAKSASASVGLRRSPTMVAAEYNSQVQQQRRSQRSVSPHSAAFAFSTSADGVVARGSGQSVATHPFVPGQGHRRAWPSRRPAAGVGVLGKSLAGPFVTVTAQLLQRAKPQVRAHMPTTANEPQPWGTDSASTSESARLRKSSLRVFGLRGPQIVRKNPRTGCCMTLMRRPARAGRASEPCLPNSLSAAD